MRKRVVLVTRVRPTSPVRNWRKSSAGARSGAGRGLRRSGVRVVLGAKRIWRNKLGKERVRRRDVRVMRVGPSAARHWRTGTERAKNGVFRGFERSEMFRKRGRWRLRCSGTRRDRKHVALVMPVRPTPVSRWGTSSERANNGVGRGSGKSAMRTVRVGRTWRSRSGKEGVPRRDVLVTRVGPTTLRSWRGNSAGAKCGLRRGLGKSGMRVACGGRIWMSSSGKRRGRRCVALLPRARPTPRRRWGKSLARDRSGARCVWRKSREKEA